MRCCVQHICDTTTPLNDSCYVWMQFILSVIIFRFSYVIALLDSNQRMHAIIIQLLQVYHRVDSDVLQLRRRVQISRINKQWFVTWEHFHMLNICLARPLILLQSDSLLSGCFVSRTSTTTKYANKHCNITAKRADAEQLHWCRLNYDGMYSTYRVHKRPCFHITAPHIYIFHKECNRGVLVVQQIDQYI